MPPRKEQISLLPAELEQLVPQLQYGRTPALLLAYIGTGRSTRAIALLQRAYAEHSNAVVGVKVGPAYDPLRSDLRFQELLRKLGLAQ